MSKSTQTHVTNKPNGSGINRIIKASQCSFKGFKAAWQYESAFRQELILVIVLVPFTFVVSSSFAHQLMLISSLLFVLFAEIINSALEALADAITLEHNPLIGRAKDMGSAGVFIALSLLVLIWGHAVYQYLF